MIIFSNTRPISINIRNNIINNDYAQDTLKVLINDDNEFKKMYNDLLTRNSSGSNNENWYDDYSITTLHTTVYFSRRLFNNNEMLRITNIKGGITTHNSSGSSSGSSVGGGVSIVSSKVKIGQTGFTGDGGYTTQSQDYNLGISRNWNKNTPSNWKIVMDHSSSDIGAIYSVTYTLNGNRWTTEIINNLT